MKYFAGLLTLCLLASSGWAQSYDIHPFAGSVLPPLPASALAVSIGGPFATAASDGAGNVYVADPIDSVVYRVTGVTATLFAGTGVQGYSGDGGAATAAELNGPRSVAIDQTGAVYIADFSNFRIRKVVNGVISTVAGNGISGFSGDGGPAVNAQIGATYFLTIAVDTSGNLYINEFSRIRKVSNGIINTIAGGDTSGDTGDGGPAVNAEVSCYAIAADFNENLYLADNTDNVIRKISNAGVISTIAGNDTPGYSGDGGPALSAQFNGPQGLAVDGSGNIYVADANNDRIRKISASGTISTYAGIGLAGFTGDGGPATNAALNYPNSVTVDATEMYFFRTHSIAEYVRSPDRA